MRPPTNMDIQYTAAFLVHPRNLIQWWAERVGVLLPNMYCHHATITHDPDERDFQSHNLGEYLRLNVRGLINTDEVQAVLIEGLDSENEHPHITVATANDVGPSESKEAFRNEDIQSVEGPSLQARVGYTADSQPHFSPEGNDLCAPNDLTGEEEGDIHVFDFDGTLFRSPPPPEDFDRHHLAWWQHPSSLSEPHVSAFPGDEWYFMENVKTARCSVQNDNVLSVLATGRSASGGLRFRIRDLLRQRDLHFDWFLLNTMHRTEHFKRRAVDFLLQKHGGRRIQVWENNHLNLYQIRQVADKHGIDFQGHLVEGHRFEEGA